MEGFDLDLVRLIERRLALRFEPVPVANWAEAETKLRSGEVDLTCSTAITPSRENAFLFTRPYFTCPVAILVRRDGFFQMNEFWIAPWNTQGMLFALPRSYATTELFARRFPKSDVLLTADDPAAIEAVERGKADATLANLAVASAKITRTGGRGLRIAGTWDADLDLRFALRPELLGLRNAIDGVLASIDDTARDELARRWIPPGLGVGVIWSRTITVAALAIVVVSIFVFILVRWNRGIAHELEKRRIAEANLLESQEEERMARKQLEAVNGQKNFFLGMVTHDLNSPLTSIGLWCELLLRKSARMDSETVAGIARIEAEAIRMRQMVRNYLDAHAIESGLANFAISKIDPGPVLDHVAERHAPSAAMKQIRLAFPSDGAIPRVSADPFALDQILDNLVANAIKYTPPCGTVAVACRAAEDRMRFEVMDEGPGILEERRAHLFKPFTRLDSLPSGAEQTRGLGLSIAARLAEQLGGAVSYEEGLEKGSVFVLDLPLADAPKIVRPVQV
jgi:signal transduction histidine kinase